MRHEHLTSRLFTWTWTTQIFFAHADMGKHEKKVLHSWQVERRKYQNAAAQRRRRECIFNPTLHETVNR